MSLIRDEDRCYSIIGIFTIVSCFSLCYPRFVSGATRLQPLCCAYCEFRCSALPLSVRWVCAPLVSECERHSATFVSVERRVSNKAASQQISARQKQPTASE